MKSFLLSCLTRSLCVIVLFLCLAGRSFGSAEPENRFQDIVEKARHLAESPYLPPEPVPAIITGLSYDQWRNIRLRPERVLWGESKLPFALQFFHPGFVYDRTVTIHIVDGDQVETLHGQRDWFNYGGLPQAPQLPAEVGLAGFRVHSAFKTPGYRDEFLVFLGGSYLRAVGKPHSYGLSARGLALDTAMPGGEEFPWFREFWVVKPKGKDRSILVYALLDSQRVSGAYEYRTQPGETTVVEVKSRLFFREPVGKVGIAPLTSMYFFGENNREPGNRDFRPEVHDSDGLQVHFGTGEWLWRPLNNPRSLQVNSMNAQGLKGFGLMQRDQDFHSYEDLEAHYQQRPSAWVEPVGDWGEGHVELVQIPTKSEIHDNVVAYWVPATPPQAGDSWSFDYRLDWTRAEKFAPSGGRVVATRSGQGRNDHSKVFIIDFDSPELRKLPDTAALTAVVTVGEGGRVLERQVQRNPYNQSWRLSFEIEFDRESTLEQVLPEKNRLIELRAFLKMNADVLTETWSYAFAKRSR